MNTEQIEKWCFENAIPTSIDLHTAFAFAEWCNENYYHHRSLGGWMTKGAVEFGRYKTDELWAIYSGSNYKGMTEEIDLLRDRVHELESELQYRKNGL